MLMLILLNSVGIYIMKEDIKVVVSIRLKDNLIKLLLFVKRGKITRIKMIQFYIELRMMVQETL
jgi:predicted transcriptional regulator